MRRKKNYREQEKLDTATYRQCCEINIMCIHFDGVTRICDTKKTKKQQFYKINKKQNQFSKLCDFTMLTI